LSNRLLFLRLRASCKIKYRHVLSEAEHVVRIAMISSIEWHNIPDVMA
jgi:hypothetical protein